jgi:iron-sulfur cluster repair protein YtfE (RIC family)
VLRDKNLVPLSHQHQHALALCVRIDRASPIPGCDVDVWQAEITQIFQAEIDLHFSAEEEIVFPAAEKFAELNPLVRQLIIEHSDLRTRFGAAVSHQTSGEALTELARRLSAHIRKEERELFEGLQQRLSTAELDLLGQQLTRALHNAVQVCTMPTRTAPFRTKI